MHWDSGWGLALTILGVVGVAFVGSAVLTALLVRRGLHTPWGIRRINSARDRIVAVVKRPITIMVLDEVADVIQTGHYTKNISAALVENQSELIDLVAQKVAEDPHTRLAAKLPGYELLVHEISGTTLRVVVQMLADPRMDELVSDLLRNNLQQIRQAVRARQHESVPPPRPPDVPAPR